MFYTYILFSESAGRYYTGSSEDAESRLQRHNAGHTKSTRGKGPWKIVATFPFESRAEAVRLEMKIKKRGAKRFLDDLGFEG